MCGCLGGGEGCGGGDRAAGCAIVCPPARPPHHTLAHNTHTQSTQALESLVREVEGLQADKERGAADARLREVSCCC